MNTCYMFTYLFLVCKVYADLTTGNSISSLITHYMHIENYNEFNCSGILEEFAVIASEFTKCSIKYSRPVRLCGNCITEYVAFHSKYQDLITNDTCKSLFISQDRLDAVLEYHDSILAVWVKGNCNGCFDWEQGEPRLSKDVQYFQIMYQETTNCIDNAHKQNYNNTKVCETCMPMYVKLDEFYKNMSIDSIGIDTVCMDVVDSMNATRFIWSKVLDCCNLRKTPEIVFLCCSALIATLPLLFYVAVRFYGPIRDLPNVLKQSRFKQVILRSSERQVN